MAAHRSFCEADGFRNSVSTQSVKKLDDCHKRRLHLLPEAISLTKFVNRISVPERQTVNQTVIA